MWFFYDYDCTNYILPSRGATEQHIVGVSCFAISTHTPLAGRDLLLVCCIVRCSYFYSHAPRGARLKYSLPWISEIYFYSHAPRGARRFLFSAIFPINTHFYSHAPRGARQSSSPVVLNTHRFLLTRPSRGATATFSSRSVGARHILGRTWFFAGISSTRRPVSREKPNIFRRTSRHFPVIAPSPDGIRLCFPRGYRIYASAHPHQITSHSCHAVILL